MMGSPQGKEQTLFSYRIHLEHRVRRDHPLRGLNAALDLAFVAPAVQHTYGMSGNISVEPAVIMKMMLLLFYYDIPSERELMEQIPMRLDFLWFLGYDLDSQVPHHSVLSKARARWGTSVFEALFVRTVQQCVQAGLVEGRLLHLDSTILKAHAARNSVRETAPELVNALRAAYQAQDRKLQGVEVLPAASPVASAPATQAPSVPTAVADGTAAPAPLKVLPPPATGPAAVAPLAQSGPKRPVNEIRISLTDPAAHLARNKSGVSELNYKDHRTVDDARGVITAVQATSSVVADGSQLPTLVHAHQSNTGLKRAGLTLAGDKHYGTVSNYLYCAEQGWEAHLGEASANLEERGKFDASQFTYEPHADRYVCPAGHFLELHQRRPEVQAKVYLITDAKMCAACPLRPQCTSAKQGRSIQRHDQSEIIERARQQTHSAAARYSRKRRRHVMEGSFADAANNHGVKQARWRGLARQKIQSWLICAVQNLRLLIQHGHRWFNKTAGALESASGQTKLLEFPTQTPCLPQRSSQMPLHRSPRRPKTAGCARLSIPELTYPGMPQSHCR